MVVERRVKITIAERAHYSKEYTLAELEEVAGVTLDDCDGDLDTLVTEVQGNSYDVEGFHEGLMKDGVVEQFWDAQWVDPTPEQVGYRTRDGIAAAVYEEEGRDE